MSRRRYSEELVERLRDRWSEANVVAHEECEQLFQLFISKFVRPDLHRRFSESFNRAGVQSRCYADRGRELGRDAPVSAWLATIKGLEADVTVRAVWGVQNSLEGVRFTGVVREIDDLRVTEDDLMVCVQKERSEMWLFFPHDNDEAWMMK